MHQDVYKEAVAEEYLRLHNPLLFEKVPDNIFFILFSCAVTLADQTLEYVDDGSDDAVELMDYCNSEMEFIDWFVDEVMDQKAFEENWC